MENNLWLDRIKDFRRSKGWDADGKFPIMFHSTINGYVILYAFVDNMCTDYLKTKQEKTAFLCIDLNLVKFF